MQPQTVGRKYKRRVSTACGPCYARKQRCDRQYPCAHCTKRRRPEECVYSSPPTETSSSSRALPVPPLGETSRLGHESVNVQEAIPQPVIHSHDTDEAFMALDEVESRPVVFGDPASAFWKSFGYFENSQSNTVALLKKWNIGGEHSTDNGSGNMSSSMFEKIQQDLERIPPREVLDFLVQYFVNELNWMKQIITPPCFLAHYQQWCSKERPLSVLSDVEFTVLVLRICAYSAQFLPSPSETIDKIRGLPLSDIRSVCSDLGERLAGACLTLDWKGSLVRVQHILFAALMSSCEGRTDKFWEQIGSASQAAQKAGLHTEVPGSGDSTAEEWERDTRRRVFCCLYILDSHLSRQLDRVPFLSDSLVAEMLPRLRLVSEFGSTKSDVNPPDDFTERLMQVELGRFWRSFVPNRNVQYDPTQGEQRYERFSAEYLPTLSRAFALEPDTRWDRHRPKLAMQRQLLHIVIFDSVCWNFRPLLLLTASQIAGLPPYKRVLLQSQRLRLSIAALKELEAVSKLHSMFGGSQIRFSAIIFNTFEAAVLLLCLSSQEGDVLLCQEEETELLGLKVGRRSLAETMQAVEKALGRLQMLADVSDMAASGAKVIAQLLSQARRQAASPPTPTSVDVSSGPVWPGNFSNLLGTSYDPEMSVFTEQSHESLMAELVSNIGNQESGTDSQLFFGFAMP